MITITPKKRMHGLGFNGYSYQFVDSCAGNEARLGPSRSRQRRGGMGWVSKLVLMNNRLLCRQ